MKVNEEIIGHAASVIARGTLWGASRRDAEHHDLKSMCESADSGHDIIKVGRQLSIRLALHSRKKVIPPEKCNIDAEMIVSRVGDRACRSRP